MAIASERKTWTIDQVAGVITSGMASPTLVLVHRKLPERESFHGSRPAPEVIGRACRIDSSRPTRHHSMSISVPYRSAIATP